MQQALQMLWAIGSKALAAAKAVPGVSQAASAIGGATRAASAVLPELASAAAVTAPELVVTAPTASSALGSALAAGAPAAVGAAAHSAATAPRAGSNDDPTITQRIGNALGRELNNNVLGSLAPDMSSGGLADFSAPNASMPTAPGVGVGLNITNSSAPDIAPWRRPALERSL